MSLRCLPLVAICVVFISTEAVSVSEKCKTELLEGTSCSIQLPTRNIDKSNDIKWTHLSSGDYIHRKYGKMRKINPGLKMEEDGSLTFESVSLKNTGKYTYSVFTNEGIQIGAGEKEIKVYAKAPKPTVTIDCKDGVATLTCNAGDRTDLTVSWYKEDKIIQNEKNPKLLLTSAQVQEDKPYSCSVRNPVSSEQSDSVTVSCATGESSVPDKLFGFDFWIMVIILAGSGALLLLLLLLICVLLFCNQRKKHQKDEKEFRLRNLQASDSTKTDPNAAGTSNYI